MKLAFYGSSLLSAYWNGAATYYRGMLKAMCGLGYDITFYEPDVYDRKNHRDIEPPDWARVVVYDGTTAALLEAARQAADADVVVKASGVGFEDDLLLNTLLESSRFDAVRIFWDVDAPATLLGIQDQPEHPLRSALGKLDAVLTYGGGQPVVSAYEALGAGICVPIYNGLDPDTHHPVALDPRYRADLAFLGNRLPDREARVEEFFLAAASRLPNRQFILGGSGWGDKSMSDNIAYIGHVGTADHNAFNVTPRAVLNVSRDSMAGMGFSPATRVFEAAGAGACLITDAWRGLEMFLKPDEEVLVARDGQDVAEIVRQLTTERAAEIGRAALARVLADHTYADRARQADATIRPLAGRRAVEAGQ
ncbi:CgeB family protein [Pelagibacterium luteolum]|uniref:Spore maturation protein CgeB n=1 Tax=Pelagibacterium luteolum TaxID=440168 RepID=A0A1G8A5P4_9HYPH|nr:glycosyltransferase [Pelagibacterium luteolum]SDH16191.1 Spore maturation protein CgeB [Pelagibacterium luteolum]